MAQSYRSAERGQDIDVGLGSPTNMPGCRPVRPGNRRSRRRWARGRRRGAMLEVLAGLSTSPALERAWATWSALTTPRRWSPLPWCLRASSFAYEWPE
jgi:hypothetical protein